jgi:hypothetical protein
VSAYEEPALPGFGRDYTQTGWNVAAAALLRALDAQHQANVAVARRLQYAPRPPAHPPAAKFMNWLTPGEPFVSLPTPSGSVPASEPYASAQPPWLRGPAFQHAGARAIAGAVGW